jgi:membrane protease YdiL (CAAX protease family)
MKPTNLKFTWATPLFIVLLFLIITILGGIIFEAISPSVLRYNRAIDSIISKMILLITLLITCKFFPIDKKLLDYKIELKKLPRIFFIGFVLFLVTNIIAYLEADGIKAPQYNSNWTYILTAVSACVLAPILEELLFRGVIFSNLKNKYSFWLSAVYSSFLFAVVHIDIKKFAYLFIIGIVLCWVLNKEKKIVYPIIIHATIAVLNRIMNLFL